jgi:hypothetical protein
MNTRFVLERTEGCWRILDRDLDLFAADIVPLPAHGGSYRYRLQTDDGQEIAIITSVDRAVFVFEEYYRKRSRMLLQSQAQ